MGVGIRTITSGVHKRYILMDDRERFWTGEAWTSELRKALRHATIQGAHEEFQRVMEELYQDKPVRTFEAVIRVRVFAAQPFDAEALRDYLERASCFSQDTERMGAGPVEGCLVLQRADYSQLREITPAEDATAR